MGNVIIFYDEFLFMLIFLRVYIFVINYIFLFCFSFCSFLFLEVFCINDKDFKSL